MLRTPVLLLWTSMLLLLAHTPVTLTGSWGTSVALKVLHRNHIKRRFDLDRRFIHCVQFPGSHTHLLSQISKAIGADIENPKDLTFLRLFVSSSKIHSSRQRHTRRVPSHLQQCRTV